MRTGIDDIPTEVVIDFLAATQFFSGMSHAVLSKLVTHLKPTLLSGGEVLMNQGDSGDSLYLVVNGRLRAFQINEQHQRTELGEMGAGEIIGELALLSELPRAATVCAIRDSLVLKLTKEKFDEFAHDHHEQLMSVTKHAIQRILQKDQSNNKKISTIAIAPAGNSQCYIQFTHDFIEILKQFGSTLHLTSKHFDELLHEKDLSQTPLSSERCSMIATWLSEQETKYKFIVYETDNTISPWSRRCVRQADRVLLVADSKGDPERNSIEHEIESLSANMKRWTDLVLIQQDSSILPTGTSNWLKSRDITQHHHYRPNKSKEDIERIIRFISGKAHGLVLGGGGARGLAHLGVYRALKELNIPIDLIGGTSAGAMLGAFVAMDLEYEDFHELLHENLVKNDTLFDYTIPLVSILSAKSWTRSLVNSYGKETAIEDLWKPFFSVSTNISKREIRVDDQGNLWRSVRASLSLPGIVPPVSTNDGDLLIDGGIMNNLPVDIMRRKANGGNIFAVNVSSTREISSELTAEGWLSGWSLLGQRLNPFKKGIAQVPSIAEIIFESITLCSINHSKKMVQEADHYLEMGVKQYGLFDFKCLDQLVKIGYETAMEKLEKLDKSS